jgi:replicative DNA helicase
MKEKNLLERMAKIISEIQTINIWIDDARTNRIARIRYQKSKLRLKDLVEAYKESRTSYDALQKEEPQCTSQK